MSTVRPIIWNPDQPQRRAEGVQLFGDSKTHCFLKWESIPRVANILIDALERHEQETTNDR